MNPIYGAALMLTAALGLPGGAGAATGRLPEGVVPLAYDIRIDPDAASLRFAGSETITIEIARPTATITLNAAELAIDSAVIDGGATATVSLDEEKQTASFHFARPIAAGRHSLAIRWTGKINEAAAGLFAIDYTDIDGKPARMLATQFEAADARRFAPMWDEPALKATFRIATSVPAGQHAFSNMPIETSAAAPGGGTLVTFRTSPKMSSYLLFLGLGDVERRTRMADGVEIGVITRRGVGDQGLYALDTAARVLHYYNAYFGTPYPLPKLDMIALPGTSQNFSAMENWGAITYFDRVLLLDPALTTESTRQYIFIVVAHEMAHQWFGDLVTMAWWDDLWLNEGFASWMENKATADLNPEWNIPAQVVAYARRAAITTDARSSTHAIVRPIATVDQIAQAFDEITYQKGEQVIRMIEAAVGPDAFRAGVRSYMAKYRYGNTVTDQLWAELDAAAGKPVTDIAHSITLNGGVPLIRASEPVCADGRTSVTLSQERFGLDAESKAATRWLVPVGLAPASTGRAATVETVSSDAPVTASIPGCAPLGINPGSLGYFVTLRAPGHLAALTEAFTGLPLPDQAGLLGDELLLANGGYVGLDRYFGLLDAVPPEAKPVIWDLVASQLIGIDRILADGPVRAAFRARAAARLRPVFERVGWLPAPGEDTGATQLRETLIQALGRFGDAQVIAHARDLVTTAIGDSARLPAAIREPVLATFAYNARPEDWDRLHALAKAETRPDARLTYYSLLGSAAQDALAEKALAIALGDEASPPLRAGIIGGTAGNHPELTFDWAAAHADPVNALVEPNSRTSFIVGLARNSADAALADRVRAFAERTLPPEARQTADTTISSIRYRARLRAEQGAAIAAWAAR